MPTFIKALGIVVAALSFSVGASQAAGRGGTASGWHAAGWRGSGFRQGYRGHPFGGGYYSGYYGGVVADDSAPDVDIQPVYVGPTQPSAPLVAPVLSLSCKHSVENVTVPSEAGAVRQIRITRC
ncbi:hypothetical protein MXD81_56970 [Microbacteriaceae bacterium K1510]|nr:hypothetical protein [Microbacteriaceae bacterium K1510]